MSTSTSRFLPEETFQSILPCVDVVLNIINSGLQEIDEQAGSAAEQAEKFEGDGELGAKNEQEQEEERQTERQMREKKADERWEKAKQLEERVSKEISSLKNTLVAQRAILLDPYGSSPSSTTARDTAKVGPNQQRNWGLNVLEEEMDDMEAKLDEREKAALRILERFLQQPVPAPTSPVKALMRESDT